MPQTILLLGNGINSINNNSSWENLLKLLYDKYYDPNVDFDDLKGKPFPMVYEQIVLWQFQKGNRGIEKELKELIAAETRKISPNPIHKKITGGQWDHIITTNYDFSLLNGEPEKPDHAESIRETKYSIFRNFRSGDKTFWHIHGDVGSTKSINLGYDHYCGQLQRMREYVTGKYSTSNEKMAKIISGPLRRRLLKENYEVQSWIDFFFKDDTTIKIIGLRLDMEELDLWWLLTYRPRVIYGDSHGIRPPMNNKIEYFIPRRYTLDKRGNESKEYRIKKDLMEKLAIKVVPIDEEHGEAYYINALRKK